MGLAAISVVDRAMRGEQSPSPVYEGQHGTIVAMLGGPKARLEVSLLDKGEPPRLMTRSFPKQWAAEYMAQPFIDLAFKMRTQIPDLNGVKSIVLTGSQDMVSVIGSGDPEKYNPDATRGTLDHSLMYIVAVALEDGTWDKDASYAPERAHRPDTIALWRKIITAEDKGWTAAFGNPNPDKRKFGGVMTVTLADGSVLTNQVDNADSYNSPQPWRRADYQEKFRTVTKGVRPGRAGPVSQPHQRPAHAHGGAARHAAAGGRARGHRRRRPLRRGPAARRLNARPWGGWHPATTKLPGLFKVAGADLDHLLLLSLPMRTWTTYPLSLAAGFFMANGVPHFVHGISGDAFPTPFAKPSGVGPSTTPFNVAWGLTNLAGGYLLFRAARLNRGNWGQVVSFFVGAAAISFALSKSFQKKQVPG